MEMAVEGHNQKRVCGLWMINSYYKVYIYFIYFAVAGSYLQHVGFDICCDVESLVVACGI